MPHQISSTHSINLVRLDGLRSGELFYLHHFQSIKDNHRNDLEFSNSTQGESGLLRHFSDIVFEKLPDSSTKLVGQEVPIKKATFVSDDRNLDFGISR